MVKCPIGICLIFSKQLFKLQLNQSLMTSVGQLPMNCSRPGISHPRANVRIWWTQLHWSCSLSTFSHICYAYSLWNRWYVILAWLGFAFLHNKAAKKKKVGSFAKYPLNTLSQKVILMPAPCFIRVKKRLSKNFHHSLGCFYYCQCGWDNMHRRM